MCSNIYYTIKPGVIFDYIKKINHLGRLKTMKKNLKLAFNTEYEILWKTLNHPSLLSVMK